MTTGAFKLLSSARDGGVHCFGVNYKNITRDLLPMFIKHEEQRFTKLLVSWEKAYFCE